MSPFVSRLPFQSTHTDLVRKRLGDVTHKEFAKDNNEFQKRCEAVGIAPTKRQAGKFRSQKGRAYLRRS